MGAAFRYPVCGDLLAQAQKIHPTLHRNLNRFANVPGLAFLTREEVKEMRQWVSFKKRHWAGMQFTWQSACLAYTKPWV